MQCPTETLVCFAVKEEAGFFQRLVEDQPQIRTLITGMGRLNAEREIRAALAFRKPSRVWSCGFAGGLDPELTTGTVVFADIGEPKIEAALLATGARAVRFHSAQRVAVTASEKKALREMTRADAVEMESHVIGLVCREHGIPCIPLRVILDTAEEDLPLDFNQLMTDDQRIDPGKLAWSVAKSPHRIPALVGLQKQSKAAAEKLAEALASVLTSASVS
jgi:adenosylhomocysteine nucleosidase